MAETCTECKQPLIEVDSRGQHLRGCLSCNEVARPRGQRSQALARRLSGAACAAVEPIPRIKGIKPPPRPRTYEGVTRACTHKSDLFTVALRKQTDGWRIAAWAWAKGTIGRVSHFLKRRLLRPI